MKYLSSRSRKTAALLLTLAALTACSRDDLATNKKVVEAPITDADQVEMVEPLEVRELDADAVLFEKAKTDIKPNIVFILTDDQGWGDLGVHGNDVVETPQLDELFTQGVSFDRFYVSPVCSPTRAAFLTGRHALSSGVHGVTRGGGKMQLDEKTLAEYLRDAGYETGLFGKWHNGLQYPYNPNGQGFDRFYGFADGHITRYFDGSLQSDKRRVSYQGYIVDRITDEAIKFIEQEREEPYFAMVSINTPHSPFELPQALHSKYKAKGLDDIEASVYGMMENIDHNVARIKKAVEKSNSLDNTIFIYASDNGPQFPAGNKRYNGNMKGNKGTVEEGGVRVPFAMYWRGHIDGGIKIANIAQHIDLLPTLLGILGEEYDKSAVQGKDLSALLAGYSPLEFQDRMLFTHRFRIGEGDANWIQASPGAVRTQRWLATLNDKDGQWRLYDLIRDPSQQNDVSADFPRAMAVLKNSYDMWFEKTTTEYREQYGEYGPMPIHLGHKGWDTVSLPSHEGTISGELLDYANGAGWSHDWIESQTLRVSGHDEQMSSAQVKWPVKVVEPGNYRINLLYAAPKGSSDRLRARLQNATMTAFGLPEFIPEVDKGTRFYDSGEAYELSWQKLDLGIAELDARDSEWLTLTYSQGPASLNESSTVQHHTRSDSSPAPQSSKPNSEKTLMIKGLIIEKIGAD